MARHSRTRAWVLVLIGLVRFAVGAALGLGLFVSVAFAAHRSTKNAAVFNPYAMAGFALAGGILCLIYGERFLNSFIEH